jgi:hypothetical protein
LLQTNKIDLFLINKYKYKMVYPPINPAKNNEHIAKKLENNNMIDDIDNNIGINNHGVNIEVDIPINQLPALVLIREDVIIGVNIINIRDIPQNGVDMPVILR